MENEHIYHNLKRLCKNQDDTIEVLMACIKILYNIPFKDRISESSYILSQIYANCYLNELNMSRIEVGEREDVS